MSKTQKTKRIQPGDYFIHVFIQETNSLSVEESNDTLDVIIEVEAFNQTKKTLKKKGIGFGTAAFYGEHFYFQKKLETLQAIEDSQIIIRVFDHKLTSTLIGTTSLSIAEVYRSKDQVIKHKWTCLSNIEVDYQKIMGYLKLSCNVTREDETRELLEDEPLSAESGNKIHNLSIPPKFRPKKMQILVNVHEADRLVGLDSNLFGESDQSDPYIEAVFGADKVRTSVKNDSKKRAVFRESLVISTIYPSLVSSFILTLYDYDNFKSDDVFGSQTIKLSNVVQKKYSEGYWLYFYGAHDFAPNKEAMEKMNQYPEIASAFKGAVYVVIKLSEIEGKEGTYCRKIGREEFLVPPPKQKYRVRFEIYSVQQVIYEEKGYNSHKHKIVVNWGGNIRETREIELKKGIIALYDYIDIEEEFATPKIEETPDIIISLVNTKKNHYVSFCRLRPEKYMMEDTMKDRYLMLNVDKSFTNDLRDDTAGILHLKIGVGNNLIGDEFSEIPIFNPNCYEPPLRTVVLIINVIQAKSLPSADEDGSADPYVLISHYGNQIKSSVINDTLSPVWNERVFLKSQVVGNFFSPIIISVYDHDDSEKDEFLGSSSIFLNENDLVDNVGYIPKPQWHNLKYTKKIVIGKIKISASVVDVNNQAFVSEGIPKAPLKINQRMENFHLKMRTLGMRNLKSDGLGSISKPFIQMEIPNFELKNGGDYELNRIKKVIRPVTGGENPNIGEILNFDLTLPRNDTMKPTISCKVYDEAKIGSPNLVGFFEINLGFFSRITKKLLIDQLDKLEQKLFKDKTKKGSSSTVKRIKDELIKETNLKKTKEENNNPNSNSGREEQNPLNFQHKTTEISINSTAFPKTRMGLSDNTLYPRITKNSSATLKNIESQEKEFLNTLAVVLKNNSQNSIPIIQHTGKDTEYVFEEDTDSEFDIEEDFDEEMKEKEIDDKKRKENKKFEGRKFVIMPEYKEEKGNIVDKLTKKKKDKRRTKEGMEEYDEEQGLLSTGKKTTKKFMIKEKLVEIKKPDLEIYREVGYDTISTKNKHYRLELRKSLEESNFKGKSEFQNLLIRKGKRISTSLNWFEKLMVKKSQYKSVGIFKGSTSLISDKLLMRLSRLNLSNEFKEFEIPFNKETWENKKLDRDILQSVKLVTRIYVLDAVIYENYDTESKSDPFLKIFLGDFEINDQNNAINDQQRPIFNRRFDIEHSLPGASILQIQIWDKDIVSDELIGETKIDLENRFYNEYYRKLENQPIEQRKLYVGDSERELGYVNLWIEMIPADRKMLKSVPIWDISSIPATEFDLRVIIWEVRDAPGVDFDGSSDLFVKVNLSSLGDGLTQKTDVHSRATGGFGSFNWRMVFPIKIDEYSLSPQERSKFRLDFQIWDSDFTSGSDFLSSATISFWNLVRDAMANEKRTKMFKRSGFRDKDEFFIKTVPNDTLVLLPKYKPSRIKISVELIPKEEAKKNPVGLGRSDPNQDPYLPAPVGRSTFTMNPYEIMMRKVGPIDSGKFIIFGVLGFCCCLIMMVVCSMIGYLLGKWIFGR